jgi:hypothetical protein
MRPQLAIGNWQSAMLPCLLAAVICLPLSGCSVATARRTPDGVITVSSFRCLWKTEAVSVNTSYSSGGFNLILTVGHSASDDKSVGAVTEGAVRALTRP